MRIIKNEWLVPIEKSYPKLEAEYNRLELDENLTDAMRQLALSELILSWGGRGAGNITFDCLEILSDPVYMAGVKEKLTLIAAYEI